MRRNFCLFFCAIFIISIFSSCSLPEPDIALRLKNRKQAIDSIIAKGECPSHFVAVLTESQEINCYYQLFHDDSNGLARASETYTRNNKTSDTTFVYYFDEHENTIAFQVKIAANNDSIFNSVTAFYNRDMDVIRKEYATIDNCDIPVNGTDSLSIDLTAYKIPPNVSTFAQRKKIILQND
ncbi:hypothetical protein [Dysgonomonas termitidis]|uniref:Lipoprotein n=1 Tax=Dysgonomonas termitidis TaxID=1516126 RepID=A0ABV9L117_9BACT